MHWIALLTIPLGYIAGQAGWVVAECGRQPWAIRDMLPTMAAISKLDVSSVQTTFFIFLLLFTVMLIAGVGIMVKAIKKGPDELIITYYLLLNILAICIYFCNNIGGLSFPC